MGTTSCQGCGTAITTETTLYTADARAVCQACFDKQDLASTTGRGWMFAAHAGVVCILVTFLVSTTSTSMTTEGDRVTSFVYRDWIAVGCGATAGALGLVALVLALRAKAKRVLLLYPIAVILAGGYKVATGFGVFAQPERSSSIAFVPSIPTTPAPPAIDAKAGPCTERVACFDLAEQLAADKKVEEAFDAYKRACDLGSKGGCNNGAILFIDDKPARAMPLLAKGCELGEQQTCTNLGFLLLNGADGVPKDAKRAAALFAGACDQKEPLGCTNLGFVTSTGTGVAKDPKRALELMIQGCELGSFKGCQNAGDLLLEGTGAKKDRKRGLALLDKACAGDAPLCHDDGIALEETDPTAARAAYTRACDAGKVASCNNLAVLWRAGKGGPKDAAKATELFQKACDGGVDVGCQNLK